MPECMTSKGLMSLSCRIWLMSCRACEALRGWCSCCTAATSLLSTLRAGCAEPCSSVEKYWVLMRVACSFTQRYTSCRVLLEALLLLLVLLLELELLPPVLLTPRDTLSLSFAEDGVWSWCAVLVEQRPQRLGFRLARNDCLLLPLLLPPPLPQSLLRLPMPRQVSRLLPKVFFMKNSAKAEGGSSDRRSALRQPVVRMRAVRLRLRTSDMRRDCSTPHSTPLGGVGVSMMCRGVEISTVVVVVVRGVAPAECSWGLTGDA